MRRIFLYILLLLVPVSWFADVDVSLNTPSSDIVLWVPFTAQVVITYGDDDLWEIYMDNLDNFSLIWEDRSDSQWFTASWVVNIVSISLELVWKQLWQSDLGPVLLKANGKQMQTLEKQINIVAAAENQVLKKYTPISSIYFKNREFDIQTLKNVTVLFTIFSVLLVAIMYGIHRQNVARRKLKYMQVLNHLETKIKSKNATEFYTQVYDLFISYIKNEKKKWFTASSLKEVKKRLSKKEYDILDLVYNVKHNVSKDSPKYRKQILKKFHKYFDKNIV